MLRDREWYDDIYKNSLINETLYSHEAEEMPYFNMWKTVIRWIGRNKRIYDFGCGTGQFIKLATTGGIEITKAIDFSSEAIEIAKKRNKNIENIFKICDLNDKKTYQFENYDVAVLLEVLEHVENDMFILNNIPKDKKIIFSVPSFDSESHVRYFQIIEEAVERYSKIVNIINSKVFCVDKNEAIWLFEATK